MYRLFITSLFAFLAFLALATAVFIALMAPPAGGDIVRISDADTAAFEWVRLNTPTASSWLLFGQGHDFYGNAAEWFPVLTGRRALNVLQGREWIGDKGAVTINGCDTADCIEGGEADYIYISDCCSALIARFLETRVPIYSRDTVTIFEGRE